MNPPSRAEEVAYKAALVVIEQHSRRVLKERKVRPANLNALAFTAARVLHEAFHKVEGYQGYPITAYAVTWELAKADNQVNLVLPKWYRDLAAKYGQ